jgi:type IX secretion system PorP/SprF family membrane protein
MKKINYVISLLIFVLALNVNAQDIHFSQINETPLFLSPANTGFFNGYVRVTANYRNQWSAMNNAFQTYALSLDGGLFKSKRRKAFMGMGFTLFTDEAGAARIRKTTALFNLSGLVKLSRGSSLSVGLAGGASATNANYSDLTFASQFDGNNYNTALASGEKVVYRQFTTTDLALGVAYEYTNSKSDQDHDDLSTFKLAFGAYHLNQPEQNFGAGSGYKLPMRLVYSFTSHFDIEDTKFSLTPAFVLQTQNPFYELIGGTYLKFRTRTGTKVTGKIQQNGIGLGLFYRVNDALIPKLIFETGDFAVGLSYDINLSSYRTASNYNGGFEVSLRYNNLANSLFASRKEFR